VAHEERSHMKLNIVNLIDNFNKFSNYLNSTMPLPSHSNGQPNLDSCIEFFNNTQNCMIFEHKPVASIKIFNRLLEKGKNGILITRNHPDKLTHAINTKNIDMYWLSAEDFDYVIHPWDITLLINIMEDFIKRNNQGIILLNGIEYLSTYNHVNVIFNLITRLSKVVSSTDAKFLVTIDPIAIGNKFLGIIKNRTEIVPINSNPFKEALV
jgi:hypothetical protein